MKKRICLLILTLSLLLTACSPAGQPEPDPVPADPEPEVSAPADPAPEPEPAAPAVKTLLGIEITDDMPERERGIIKDLDTLRKEFEYRHENPYYRCSKEEFEWKLEQLAGKVGELSDTDIYFEIAAIVAAMDDTVHTAAINPDYIFERMFPMTITCYGDRAYLSYCLEGYEQLAPFLLREVVAVNGVDMAYIRRKAESILGPYNSWLAKEYFFSYARCPAFYDWVGCDYKEGYTFQFLNENQEVVSVEVPTVSKEEYLALYNAGRIVRPENSDNILYLKIGNWTKYVQGENGGCIYVSYSDVFSNDQDNYMGTIAIEACELAEAHPDCRKLVIDLRRNPGGYFEQLKYFKEHMEPLKSSIEQTYVLVGGMSTSAAPRCAAFFKGEMNATIVGEPMGEFISFYCINNIGYAQPLPVFLSHTQIEVKIATGWTDVDEDLQRLGYTEWGEFASLVEEYRDEDGNVYDWESTILPDVYVYQDIEDIRQGKDSVLEWVLRQ